MKPDPQDVEALRQSLAQMAGAISEYVEMLTDAGLSRDEAVQLALAWQDSVIRRAT